MADRIEVRCTAARTQAQRLSPLARAKAFRGELVAQDPNAEPASVLLAGTAAKKVKGTDTKAKKVPVAQFIRAKIAITL